MKRRTARENALLAIFEYSFEANSMEEIIAASREADEYAVDAYGEALLINFCAHRQEIDETIAGHLKKGWSLSRLPRVNLSILRLAVTEMLYSEEDMDSIVANEAVELAKKYAGDDDYQFINGILGSISRSKEKK